MAKSKSKGGSKSTTTLLRLSGMIFLVMGIFHVLRYFEIVRRFEFTLTGSLVLGCLLLLLSYACFFNAK